MLTQTTPIRYGRLHVAVRHSTESARQGNCTHLDAVIALTPLHGIRPGQDITDLLTLAEQLDMLHRAVLRSN
jgi:hypothetical protein